MSLSPSKNLVEFRAGKLYRDGNLLRADARKGLLFANRHDELLHICWKDRKTNAVEDDYIVFPQDAVFEKVPQCTTGRALVLNIASAETKLFFWMQEPKDDKDEEYLKALNRLINDNGMDFQPAEESMHQDELYRMLQSSMRGAGAATSESANPQTQRMETTQPSSAPALASTTAPTPTPAPAPAPTPAPAPATSSAPTPAPSSSQGGIGITDLQNILSGIQVPESKPDSNLSRILTPENVLPLLEDPTLQQALFPFIPESAERSRGELEDLIRSPQFQEAVGALNAGLQSGQLAPLVAQLGLDPSVAGPFGGVEAFLRAIVKRQEQQKK